MKTSKILGVRDVAKSLSAHPDTHATVMRLYRALGGRLDAFDASRMAEALTRVENATELALRGRWTAERAALRGVRRRVEKLLD